MVRNAASFVLIAAVSAVLAIGNTPARAVDVPPPPTSRQEARTVVGGDLAPAGMFPGWFRLSMGCGGALTAPRVVLTAALRRRHRP